VFSFSVASLHFASVSYCKWSFADITVEPFFNTCITTRQDGGRRNLLVDAVIQASQAEVGISMKKLRIMLAQMGTSQTDSVSETGVEHGVKSNRSDCKETRTVGKTYKLNTITYKNMI
jgi:hypothetical protein